jgi:phage gp29-like protein
MLSLHDIFDKIKTKFQELECEWTGQMEEYTNKKILPPKKVFFQFNKITFSSLRLQDLGSNFTKFSWGGGACPNHPSMFRSLCDPQPVMVIFS